MNSSEEFLKNKNAGSLQDISYNAATKVDVKTDSKPSLEDKTVLLLDPMIATGGSLIDGIDFLKSKGAKKIISLNILGAPEGIKTVQDAHPDVDIFIAQIDERLDDNKYIRPGLGDAGDRAFNTN